MGRKQPMARKRSTEAILFAQGAWMSERGMSLIEFPAISSPQKLSHTGRDEWEFPLDGVE